MKLNDAMEALEKIATVWESMHPYLKFFIVLFLGGGLLVLIQQCIKQ